jgi:acetoin utilization deacetylase AcuC-like enzyme
MGTPKPIKSGTFKEQYERERQAEIDAVIAEFGGDADASAALTGMAQALLHYRHLLRQFIDAGEMIQQGKPFIVMGPGPHWKPDSSKQWPRR